MRPLLEHLLKPGDIGSVCSYVGAGDKEEVVLITLSEPCFTRRGTAKDPYDERYIAVWHPDFGACVLVAWYEADDSYPFSSEFQPRWRGFVPYEGKKLKKQD